MIGTVCPARPHPPEIRAKHCNGQKKEDARHFKPQNAADPPEWPQKAAHTAGDSATDLNRSAAGGLCRILHFDHRIRSLLMLRGHRGLRCARQLLACHSSGDAHPGPKHASDNQWSHSVYDGSSDAG